MAGGFSDYLENEILDHIFGVGSYSAPATVYVGLATAACSDTTTGSIVTEPSGGSYARVSVTNSGTNWNTASSGSISNKTAITFPEATASWGEVTDFFIADAATNGNILVWGDLTASKTIGTGDTASFAAGDLQISLD